MSHRISSRRFRLLPHAADLIRDDGIVLHVSVNGKDVPLRRWQFVYSAAGALIASQTPGGRYNLRRAGFVAFERWAKVLFPMLSTMKLDTNELRAVYEGIGEYMQRYEWHLQQGLEKLYEIERRSLSADLPVLDEPRVPMDRDEIAVESVRDGSLRRVQ